MASLDEMEQEIKEAPKTDEVFERMKRTFIVDYAYPYNRHRLEFDLDKILEHVRKHR